jgi:hypothetical protein
MATRVEAHDVSSVTDKIARFEHSTPYDEAGKKLAEFLCKAAGQPDTSGVTSITCRVASNEVVKFTIERFGDKRDIEKALEST